MYVEYARCQPCLLTLLTLVDCCSQLRGVIDTSREYILGLTMELERRRLVAEEPDNVKRQLELAAYFAHCDLQPAHQQLALQSAVRSRPFPLPLASSWLISFQNEFDLCRWAFGRRRKTTLRPPSLLDDCSLLTPRLR